MKLIFLVILTVWNIFASAQYRGCDTINIFPHSMPFDPEGIQTTVDYIKTYFPKQKRYISDRSSLKPIDLVINHDTIMIFEKGDTKIEISFGKRVVEPDVFYPRKDNELYTTIRSHDKGPYGITSEDSIANCINEIKVNSVILPFYSFKDLYNPNRFETVLGIKPIEAYLSNNGQTIFLYVCGRLALDLMPINDAVTMSYMAKIMITNKGYYIDRIVADGLHLSHFGFGSCPLFKGF
jgi:hypothetical protein